MTAVLLFLAVLVSVSCAQYQPTWDSLDKRPLPKWYDDVKFGIFMHWGVYSVPSYQSEWFWFDWKGPKPSKDVIEFMEANYRPDFAYADFAPMFKAELFDPDEWAETLAASGAKYIVLTSKHHEGFCNWDTETSQDWNSMDVGPFRDLVGDLAKSIRNKTDIHFGLYFSQFEFFHPLYLEDKAGHFATQKYPQMVSIPQMHEIVNQYKPDVIWSDGDWEAPDRYWNSTEFLAWLYNDSPVKDSVVVNDRWGSGCACHHGGYYTCQDRYNPGHLLPHKWENAMTIQRSSWGLIRNTNISGYLTINEILTELITTVSCGGNMLMNFGPNHDGRIMPVFKERLNQTGTWLAINGEAIYSTKPWKFQNDTVTPGVWYTTSTKTGGVYAMLLDWPSTYTVTLGALKGMKATSITLMGYKEELKFQDVANGVEVMLPFLPLDTPLKWAWTLKIMM
jgi:alpha-L-fucosidase